MTVSMFLSLPHCALDIFATEKRVNHGREQGIKIPVNFQFYGLENDNKLAKKYNNKDQRKRKRNCKTLSVIEILQFRAKFNKTAVVPYSRFI